MSASKMAVRMIGSIPVATNDSPKYGIVYKSQKTLSQIVSKFIVSNKYHDRKFKANFIVIDSETQDNVTYNMRVKNRVPYVIEVTASSELWNVDLYSKKPVKNGGYSHEYLENFLDKLEAYLIENDDNHVVEIEIEEEPFVPFKQIVELIPDLRNRNTRFFLYVMWCIVFLRIFHKK
jgi:hypothetical protein